MVIMNDLNALGTVGRRIVTSEEMTTLDTFTIDTLGVDTRALMETAGRAVASRVNGLYTGDEHVVVLIGPGHNGADGCVVARVLWDWGWQVEIRSPFAQADLSPLCSSQLATCRAMEVPIALEVEPNSLASEPDLFIDALFGTGLKRVVEGRCERWISALNHRQSQTVSVDIPSGICGTTGTVRGVAIHAKHTISFQASKWGHWAFPGADYRGCLWVEDIGISPIALARGEFPERFLMGNESLHRVITSRPRNTHKGSFGHVAVVGGHLGMVGAAKLAARAAMRAGAGKCTILCEGDVARTLPMELETVMCQMDAAVDPLDRDFDEPSWVANHEVYVVGCGLEPTRLGKRFEALIASDSAMVLDAGALGWLGLKGARHLRDNKVLTPHAKEAAVLLGTTVEAIESDRLTAIRALCEGFKCVVVLKGAYTLVASPTSGIYLNPFGNAGMATAGMGDVLAGVIGGLMAQGVSALDAARAGVVWHAKAGDLARESKGECPMIASDVIERLPEVVSC